MIGHTYIQNIHNIHTYTYIHTYIHTYIPNFIIFFCPDFSSLLGMAAVKGGISSSSSSSRPDSNLAYLLELFFQAVRAGFDVDLTFLLSCGVPVDTKNGVG